MNFYGYRRPDGRVGVRNMVLILPASVPLIQRVLFRHRLLDRLHLIISWDVPRWRRISSTQWM